MQTPPPINPIATPRTAGLAIASLVLGILSVTCLSILAGIPALILGIVALNKVGQSAGTLTGKGISIAGIVMGGISFALIPIMAIGAALLVPAVSSARDKAQEVQCLYNVRQCTLACLNYAQAHDAALPQTWDDAKTYFGNETAMQKVLYCRKARGAAASYEIVQPGKRLTDLGHPEETIIVRETGAPHHGKHAVGFADGRVEMRAGT